MGFAQGEEKMAKLTLEEANRKGFLKISDEFQLERDPLTEGLFNVKGNKDSAFIEKEIKGKKVKRRIWSVRFDSKKIERYNVLLEEGMKIRETLNKHFDMENGELRAVFRDKGFLKSWEFLGIFKFIGEDKPKISELQDMPSDCYTNCYERISDGLILEDWQANT